MNNTNHLQTNLTRFNRADAVAEFEWQRHRVEKICAILQTILNKEVGADIGCLGGMATARYAATGIKTLHGYDISETSLNELRVNGFEAFYWNVDGDKCPMPANTYDVIIAGEIIEHVIDTESFAAELYRILKPGGYLILSTPNLACWYNRLRLLRGRVPISYPGPSSQIRKDPFIDLNHIRVNVLNEWVHFLQTHNFTVKATYGSSHFQVYQGGLSTRLFKLIDRMTWKKPSLAVNLIIVATKDFEEGTQMDTENHR